MSVHFWCSLWLLIRSHLGSWRRKKKLEPTPDDNDQNPVLQGDLAVLLDSFKSEMSAAYDETSEVQMSRTAAQIGSHFNTTEARLNVQHQAFSNIVTGERVRTSQLEAEQNQLKARVKEM
jgi:hypothetical protein